ncbi:hypothetical protein [Rhodoferax sp. GW822-FHT02A01]|uniref:hypothetical protein n=1 Tax=Rhodoferax sp. GW822-FHT02A01 TaxID=3141537 RepID=UPI00315DCC96
MSKQSIATVLLVCSLFGASAQTALVKVEDRPVATTSTSRLVSSYSTFAGSQSNAKALVQGLESGQSVTLAPTGVQTPTNQPVTFTPATAKLSPGEVNIALSLAKAELSKAGITQPSPAQLAAALNGGSVTSPTGSQVQMTGVLSERSAGMGWGQIAHALGFKLGALVSASKTDQAGQKEKHESNSRENARKGDSADGSHAGGNGGGDGGSHGGGKK